MVFVLVLVSVVVVVVAMVVVAVLVVLMLVVVADIAWWRWPCTVGGADDSGPTHEHCVTNNSPNLKPTLDLLKELELSFHLKTFCPAYSKIIQ